MRFQRLVPGLLASIAGLCAPAVADRPGVAYVFPAGGQRGKNVAVRVGGYNLHEQARLHLAGGGIAAPPLIRRTKTVFFDGPVIPMPASQRKEDYPRDYAAALKIAANAVPGERLLRASTSQGVTPPVKFVVGTLPEVVEQEIDGEPVPVQVPTPVTINGRIHPREDVDVWTFSARAGRTFTCEVNAARIGSPLDSRLEIRDPQGRRIAENVDAVGRDSRVRFTARQDGLYSVRIHDINFAGLQSYVYRLTITAGPWVDATYPLGGRRGSTVNLQLFGGNVPPQPVAVKLPSGTERHFSYRHADNAVALDLDDLPELVEERVTVQNGARPFAVPAVCNGRILQPGEVDRWSFDAGKGQKLSLQVRAARLGSPLDSVLSVFDASGKQLAANDDRSKGRTDAELKFTAPADGRYILEVGDRLASRGGEQFAYRLRVAEAEKPSPGFRIVLPGGEVNVDRGGKANLKLSISRTGGFQDEIELHVDGLPKGVTVTGNKVAKKKTTAQLTFAAGKTAPVAVAELRIRGTATVAGKRVDVTAATAGSFGVPPVDRTPLAVAVPTPFKFTGVFQTNYCNRGATFTRHYALDRGGFTGVLTVRLADRQIRHLQGVTGPVVELPKASDKFDYTISLPPWMEVGRTSRTCVMLVGEVIDPDATRHTVCYSSQAQNDQIIALVDPGRLSVRSIPKTLKLQLAAKVKLPVEVGRGSGLSGPMQVELIVPHHVRGVTAYPVRVPAGKRAGELTIHFTGDTAAGSGPFNMPLTIRATLTGSDGRSHTAESPLTIVH